MGFGQARIVLFYIARLDSIIATHVNICMKFPVFFERPHEMARIVFPGFRGNINGNAALVFLPGYFAYFGRNKYGLEFGLVGFAVHGHFHCIVGVVFQCLGVDDVTIFFNHKFGCFTSKTVLPDDMDLGIQDIGRFLIAIKWSGISQVDDRLSACKNASLYDNLGFDV